MTENPFWCKKCETLYENKCTCVKVKAEHKEMKPDHVLIHKDLLTELLENTIECYNNYKVDVRPTTRSNEVLARYNEEVNQVRKLLGI